MILLATDIAWFYQKYHLIEVPFDISTLASYNQSSWKIIFMKFLKVCQKNTVIDVISEIQR